MIISRNNIPRLKQISDDFISVDRSTVILFIIHRVINLFSTVLANIE